MYLSFFPRFFHLQPCIYLPQPNKFFCLLYWKYSPTKPKCNNYSKRFSLNQLKIGLYALLDKRNLCSAMYYFTCIYCPKLVIHSNQIKLPMASSVDYIISWKSQCPSAKFCPCVLVHKRPKIFIWNASLEFISHHLPWKRQSTYKLQKLIPLCYVNVIMTESIRPLLEMMLMFFQFLKSLGYMCNLCCQNETSITKLTNNSHLKNEHFRTLVG